jgi:hypothetical protein
MDLSFVLFVFVAILIVLGGSYGFYASGQEIVAAIYFLGAVSAMVVYGMRWFSASGKQINKNLPGSWPPVINTCPDFLTLHKRTSGTTSIFECIDQLGITTPATLEKTTDPATQTDAKYKFSLHLEKSGEARAKALCAECSSKGVTWEGVYDGSICIGNLPPVPT